MIDDDDDDERGGLSENAKYSSEKDEISKLKLNRAKE